jgi:hypothetical protein
MASYREGVEFVQLFRRRLDGLMETYQVLKSSIGLEDAVLEQLRVLMNIEVKKKRVRKKR